MIEAFFGEKYIYINLGYDPERFGEEMTDTAGAYIIYYILTRGCYSVRDCKVLLL